MVRGTWIVAVTVAVVLVSSPGCEEGAGNAPVGSTDSAPTTATTKGTPAEQTTTNPLLEADTHDPPAQVPQKQVGLFFPQLPQPTRMGMAGLGLGELFVKDRCIYMGTRRHHADVVVWPYGYSLERKGAEIRVLDEQGRVVARVGEQVELGGGEITQAEAGPTPEAARQQFEEKRGELGVPDRCRGPLFVSWVGVITKPQK